MGSLKRKFPQLHYISAMMPSDQCMVIGSAMHALAVHVTSLVEINAVIWSKCEEKID